MSTKIYHGSEHRIETPVFHAGNPKNDYGYGFYCTETQELAMEWAVSREHDGYANAYEINLTGLAVLNMNSECLLLNWLAVLLANRTFNLDTALAREAYRYILQEFSVDLDPYDIIIGYRADDSYFSFAQDFLNNTISYEQLGWAMKLGYLGDQFVLRSKAAFSRLQFLQALPAKRKNYLAQKEQRDPAARAAYLGSDRMRYHRGELYVTEILDRRMQQDDPRLQ